MGRGCRWTAAETRALRDGWQDVGRATLLARLPGRTWCAVHTRARRLGLGMGVRQGHLTLRAAARVLGFHHQTLPRILAWAGVPVVRCHGLGRVRVAFAARQQRPHRWRTVDADDARAAVERWLAAETPTDAARRLGVPRRTLHDWVTRAGHRPAVPRGDLRLGPEVYDALAAAHGRGPARAA
jgi:predicted DNA-binding protein (UPF0251 family)